MLFWIAYYLYLFFQAVLLLYSIIEFTLLIRYLFRKKSGTPNALSHYPEVTIQLPLYNEKYVVDRLIDSICSFDYPSNFLEIQVLDDSNDETSSIVAEKVKYYQNQGIDIKHIQRTNRSGYKAGALSEGLASAKGEFIAIFDADFLPKKSFLKYALPYFSTDKIGVVQTRWTHINENNSLLTKVQSIFLNTHFTVEQMGRNESGAFINFNGTAGIWRKDCIIDSGGWQSDTLTEDLDLSFRAQLKGWEFKYLIDQESPAELPDTLTAFKVQQFRWSKGAAECTKKNLGKLFASKNLRFLNKLIGSFHLLNSSAYIVIVSFILLSLPLAIFFNKYGSDADALGVLNFTYLTSALLFLVFLFGNLSVSKNKLQLILLFPLLFPLFLMTSMGISFYLMTGVIEGYIGKKTEFVRTPKFNIGKNDTTVEQRSYKASLMTPIFALEILLLVYCIIAIIYTYSIWNLPLLIYEIMFTCGLLYNLISSTHYKLTQ